MAEQWVFDRRKRRRQVLCLCYAGEAVDKIQHLFTIKPYCRWKECLAKGHITQGVSATYTLRGFMDAFPWFGIKVIPFLVLVLQLLLQEGEKKETPK